MNEEAGFIAALLAEADDRTTLLVYADWLDERSDPRAEYVRFLATAQPNQRRLTERLIVELRLVVDPIWDLAVTERIGCGSPVRITEGSFRDSLGEITAVRQDETGKVVLTVRLTFWGHPLDVEIPSSVVERIATPAS